MLIKAKYSFLKWTKYLNRYENVIILKITAFESGRFSEMFMYFNSSTEIIKAHKINLNNTENL